MTETNTGLGTKLRNVTYSAQNLWASFRALFPTGLITALNSDLVYHDGGLLGKTTVVDSLLRYGFSVSRQLWYAAEVEPERLAIIDEMGERTYREARDDTQALARALMQMGYGYGSNIAVFERNSRAVVYAMVAKGFIGANLYLLNPNSSGEQLQATIDELGIDVVFIDEEYTDRLPADYSKARVFIGAAEDPRDPKTPNSEWLSFQQLIDNAPSAKQIKLPYSPKKGNFVIMSSGTSGTPKAVVHREPVLPTPVTSIMTRIAWRKHQMIQLTASLFHSWGWANLNFIFGTRSTALMRRHFDPKQAMEDVEKYKVNGVITSPIFTKDALAEARKRKYDHSSLEFMVSSGNAMSEELVRGLQKEFGPIISNFYGSTENSVCAIASPEDLLEHPRTAGRACGGVRLLILDDDGKPVKQGEPGRIYSRSVMTMRRYALKRDQMKIDRGLLAVGDRGYLDEEGRLFVLGRTDDMIIVGGENVYPRSCEEVLARMPGIKDLYVGGVDDEVKFKRLAVWLVREDSPEGEALTAESVQTFVRENLAEHSVPRDVVFMDELPRNPTGKVMPRMLPASR